MEKWCNFTVVILLRTNRHMRGWYGWRLSNTGYIEMRSELGTYGWNCLLVHYSSLRGGGCLPASDSPFHVLTPLIENARLPNYNDCSWRVQIEHASIRRRYKVMFKCQVFIILMFVGGYKFSICYEKAARFDGDVSQSAVSLSPICLASIHTSSWEIVTT